MVYINLYYTKGRLMFKRKDTTEKKESFEKTIPVNAPISGYPDPDALRGWYEKYSRPVIERNKAYLIASGLTVAVLILALALLLLIPLKQDIPFIIEVNSHGIPIAKPIAVETQQPITHSSIYYFSSIWIRNLLTIDPGLSHSYLVEDYKLSSGSGRNAFMAWINNPKNNPLMTLKTFPSERATVKITSINFLGNNYDEILVSATQFVSKNGNPEYTVNYTITLSFTVSYPKTLRSAYQNPIGFNVVNLSISKGAKTYVNLP
jgi:type IV secretory pathway component VirB8